MKRRLLAGLIPILLALSGPVHADIYAFVDKNGVRHLSNVPNDPRYKLVMRTPAYSKQAAQPSSYAPSGLYGGTAITPRNYAQKAIRAKPLRVNEQNRQRFAADVNRIAAQYRLEPALMHAVISAESSYNPWAVSPKGAMGLMQLMPATAREMAVTDPFDPEENIQGGVRYLSELLRLLNHKLPLALAAYNAGPTKVLARNEIPPIEETQDYVQRVLRNYKNFKYQKK